MTGRIPLAFPVMIGAIGLILAGYSLVNWQKASASTDWPPTRGVILNAQIRPEERIGQRQQKSTFYDADVTYSYTVNGIDYFSDKIRIDRPGQTQSEEARRLIAQYRPGKTVTVFYNPANPADAVLEPGATPQATALLACGIALIAVAAVMLVVRAMVRHRDAELGLGSRFE